MMVTIPDGLTEGASFVVNVPTMPIAPIVAAVPVPDIVDIVRKKGPLGIEAAKQYAYSIPPESRKIEGCRNIYCGNNLCCPGCWDTYPVGTTPMQHPTQSHGFGEVESLYKRYLLVGQSTLFLKVNILGIFF